MAALAARERHRVADRRRGCRQPHRRDPDDRVLARPDRPDHHGDVPGEHRSRRSAAGDATVEILDHGTEHVLRLSGQRVRGPTHPNLIEGAIMLTRLRDEERGMAMVIALIVSMVLLTLATVIVAQSVHDAESSGMDRRRLQSVNAAEAGN